MHSVAECEKEIQRLRELLNRLVKVGLSLSNEKDTDKLLNMILKESMYITQSDAGSIYITEKAAGKEYLVFKASKNNSVDFKPSGDKLIIDINSAAGYVALTGETLVLRKGGSLTSGSSFSCNKYYNEKFKYRTVNMMTIPMKDYNGNIVGVLQILNKKISNDVLLDNLETIDSLIEDYSEDEKEIIASLAAQTAILLERIKLSQQLEKNVIQTRSTMISLFYNMKDAISALGEDILGEQDEFKKYATTDELTGLLTRREGLSYMQKQLEFAKVTGVPLVVGFTDVNGLKEVNDKFGHFSGDELLSSVARIIKEQIRNSDTVIRYGGDEFVLLLYNTTLSSAESIWNRVLEKFNEFNIGMSKPFRLSASHGFCQYIPGSSDNIEDLICQADKLMYEEKKILKGRTIR